MSLAVIICICIGAFAGLTVHMEQRNKETVGEAAGICLEQMATQIRLHFSSVLGLYTSRLEDIVWRVPPERQESGEQMRDQLVQCADNLGFCYVALYDEAGVCEVVSGESMVVGDAESFFAEASSGRVAITDGIERSLASQQGFQSEEAFRRGEGATSQGEQPASQSSGDFDKGAVFRNKDATHLILGIQAAYPMDAGHKSAVLVVGLPMDLISRTLSLDVSETQVYSHIVRADGSFVLRNSSTPGSSLFDCVRQSAQEAPIAWGSSDSWDEPDALGASDAVNTVVERLQDAMARGESFSFILNGQDGASGAERNVCVTPLPGTNWYLVSVLPQELIGVPLTDLVNSQSATILVSCGLLIVAILFVFVLYVHLERKQMKLVERARREADAANQAKSMFLSNMSHDIRTPMNAIMGLASVSLGKIGDDEVIESNLRKIELSSKHLLGLVNNVLDMSLIESGRLSIRSDSAMLEEIVRSVAGVMQPQMADKGISFTVTSTGVEGLTVMCDSVRLSQALLNLLSNALKFTPEGGAVSLDVVGVDSRLQGQSGGQGQVQGRPQPQDGQSGSQGHCLVKFFVRDNGIGMSEEFQQRIFGAFEREDSTNVRTVEGSGLGMAITKSIVDAMGGTISVESKQGIGSKFVIAIDFACAPSIASGGAAAANNAHTANEREVSGVSFEGVLGAAAAVGGAATADGGAVATEGACAPNSVSDGSAVADNAVVTEGAAAHADAISVSGKRILVAEDQELNWEVVSALLESYAPLLEWAKDGKECLDMFRSSALGYYDAVLMDLQMPRMDGYQATRAIRELANERIDAREIPIIAMTADVFTGDVARSKECGMNAHVPKPIDVKVLVSVLTDCMRARRSID